MTGLIVVDLDASAVHEVPLVIEGAFEAALGDRHLVDKPEGPNGPFRLMDLETGDGGPVAPELITAARFAHALGGERFLLSGYGADGRYRYVVLTADGPATSTLLDLPAPPALRHHEVLLSPDRLLVARWSPAAAIAAGGDLPDVVDLRTGQVLVDVGLLSACLATEMPCVR